MHHQTATLAAALAFLYSASAVPLSTPALPAGEFGGLSGGSPAEGGLPSPTFHLPSEVKREAKFSLPAGFSLPAHSFPGPSHTSTRASVSTPAVATPATATSAKATSAAVPSKTASSSGFSGSFPGGSGGSSTEDGVKDGSCGALTYIFARGTSETGNMGSVIGPPLASSLRSRLGKDKVVVQGVDYPASTAGNANGGADGGSTMANLIKQALSNCPNTKVVASGYSQGGMVVHNAFSANGITSKQVAAAVIFGDPFNGQAVGDLPAGKTKEYCADGDNVCSGTGSFAITQAHMSYGDDADGAASWIISTLGL